MTRGLQTVQGGDFHTINITRPDWELLLDYQIVGAQGLVPGQRSRWDIGRYFTRPAHDLWTAAVSEYERVAPQIDAIRQNPDLHDDGKARRALEIIQPVIDALEAKEAKMNAEIADLVQMAPKALQPVQPLADKDVMGEMRDQEIRTFLHRAGSGERSKLLGEMVKGSHPELTAAVLRAPSYLVTGFSELETQRLEKAGIAAAHADDIEALDALRLAFDDARTAALRAVKGLAEILGTLQLRQGSPLSRKIEPAFKKNFDLETFHEWLKSIPRPPKRAERLETVKAAS